MFETVASFPALALRGGSIQSDVGKMLQSGSRG